ncbi:peroxiredoxin family protein [Gammaproteobacteria bacterium]|nr:peroxiredoxin family protein [Gammaproteobacteria bacterium]
MLKGYEERRAALEEQGVSVVAASVDSESKALEVAANLGFPVAWGVSREDGEKIGAWWEPVRNCIQPSEFVLGKNGKVIFSNYSNSPVGRMDPEETLVLIKYLNEQRKK